MSLVLFGHFPIRASSLLPLAAGLAVRRALLDFFDEKIALKWPNDLMAKQRKIAGILCEAKLAAGAESLVRSFVVGIGLNVNRLEFPEELKDLAASLRSLEPDRSYARTEIVCSILREFAALWPLCLKEDSNLIELYAEHCINLGRRVKVPSSSGAEWEGVAVGLDESGALLLRDERTGEVRVCHSGESVLL